MSASEVEEAVLVAARFSTNPMDIIRMAHNTGHRESDVRESLWRLIDLGQLIFTFDRKILPK